MPKRPLRPCSYYGCPNLTGERFCAAHKQEERIQPWIRTELRENENSVLPREGIGCWHPVFPAAADLLYILAGTAVEEIGRLSAGLNLEARLVVFEQLRDGERFEGIRRISSK